MIRHIWSVICQSHSIDKESNNISLFNVLEQVKFSPTPVAADYDEADFVMISLSFEFVSLWERLGDDETEQTSVRLVVHDPDGKRVGPDERQMSFSVEKARQRTIVRVASFPYSKPGRYEFSIEQESGGRWNSVALVPLTVTTEEWTQP